MTNDAIPTLEEVINKVLLLGFTEVDKDDSGTRHFSRQTVVGAPRDTDGDKIFVFVAVDKDSKCSMCITAPNRQGWVNIEYTDLTPDFFFRNMKSIERQVVYAWRELAD